MKILALDISTKTGWAYFEDGALVRHGTFTSYLPVTDYGIYPRNYIKFVASYTNNLYNDIVNAQELDVIVIEETNKSKARYSQKLLEFIHCLLLHHIWSVGLINKVKYVNTSDWRKVLDIYLSKDDKKNNALVTKAKRKGKSKKELGVKGRITRKHVAVKVANEMYNLNLKQKDNDQAEAILLGTAYIKGVSTCDGH